MAMQWLELKLHMPVQVIQSEGMEVSAHVADRLTYSTALSVALKETREALEAWAVVIFPLAKVSLEAALAHAEALRSSPDLVMLWIASLCAAIFELLRPVALYALRVVRRKWRSVTLQVQQQSKTAASVLPHVCFAVALYFLRDTSVWELASKDVCVFLLAVPGPLIASAKCILAEDANVSVREGRTFWLGFFVMISAAYIAAYILLCFVSLREKGELLLSFEQYSFEYIEFII